MMNEAVAQPETSTPKEIGPRYKILVLQFNPGTKPEMQMAELMFGRPQGKEPTIEDYGHLLVSWLQALSAKEQPDKFQRELKADKEFDPRQFFEENPEDVQGIIITGSPFAAYPRATLEGRPYLTRWKKETIAFLRSAIEHQVPVLGICFGAQILAEALGGKTEKMKTREGKEVLDWGWSRISRTPGSADDLVMKGLPAEFVAAQNRRNCISRLPPGATLLAENEYGVQGFRIDGENGQPTAWGFQFHPERAPKGVNRFLFAEAGDRKGQERVNKRRQELIEAGLDPDKIASLAEKYLRQEPQVTIIFSNFLNFVKSKI